MRNRGFVGVALALLLAGVSTAAEPNRTTDREGWPRTRPAELAHRWVNAFSTGEKAMKECLAEVMAPANLAQKGVPARIERYRDLKQQYGSLTLVSVDKSTPEQIEVTLADADRGPHVFVFDIQKEAPFKLLAVSMKQQGHGFGWLHH